MPPKPHWLAFGASTLLLSNMPVPGSDVHPWNLRSSISNIWCSIAKASGTPDKKVTSASYPQTRRGSTACASHRACALDSAMHSSFSASNVRSASYRSTGMSGCAAPALAGLIVQTVLALASAFIKRAQCSGNHIFQPWITSDAFHPD